MEQIDVLLRPDVAQGLKASLRLTDEQPSHDKNLPDTVPQPVLERLDLTQEGEFFAEGEDASRKDMPLKRTEFRGRTFQEPCATEEFHWNREGPQNDLQRQHANAAESLESMFDEAQKGADGLQRRLSVVEAALQREIASLQQVVQDGRAHISSLQDMVARLRGQLTASAMRSRRDERSLGELERSVDDLKATLARTAADNERLADELRVASRAVDDSTLEVSRVKEAAGRMLHERDAALERLHEDLADKDRALASALADTTALNEQNAALQDSVAQYNTRCSELQRNCDDANTRLNALNALLESRRRNITSAAAAPAFKPLPPQAQLQSCSCRSSSP